MYIIGKWVKWDMSQCQLKIVYIRTVYTHMILVQWVVFLSYQWFLDTASLFLKVVASECCDIDDPFQMSKFSKIY